MRESAIRARSRVRRPALDAPDVAPSQTSAPQAFGSSEHFQQSVMLFLLTFSGLVGLTMNFIENSGSDSWGRWGTVLG